MRKFLVFFLVSVLTLQPIFCSGQRELSLKTIFIRDSVEEQTMPKKTLTEPTLVQNSQVKSTGKLETSGTNISGDITKANKTLEELTDKEIVEQIVVKADDVDKINVGTLVALGQAQSDLNQVEKDIEELGQANMELERERDSLKADKENLKLDLSEKNGDIDVLKEQLKEKQSLNYVLVGANYNLKDGYGVSLDFGTKFNSGFMSQIGVSAPLDAINPVGLLDINSYTFSTKFGWSW